MDADIQAPGANPENLLSLVRGAWEGKVVVPEFQRLFVWPRESVEELLASLLNRYFVGTLLTLDTPAHSPLFPNRLLEGVTELRGPQPPVAGTVRLVLDGQQRLTSLFYAVHEPPIPLKGTSNPYRFFVYLEPALADDMDEAVVGVSTGWKRGIQKMEEDVASNRTLPLSVLANHSRFYPWLYSQSIWDDEIKERLTALHRRIAEFMIPVVSLVPETGADNIVNIFERVNRTGIPLSLFDLVAARMYLRGLTSPTLHDLWSTFETSQPGVTGQVGGEGMLRLIALLEKKELKKATLLHLDDYLGKDSFLARWDDATTAMGAARERLRVEYGAYGGRLIPYSSMMVPLAALMHHFRAERLPAVAYKRLDVWYWTSVFGQRYESGVNTKTVQDVTAVAAWCAGGDRPAWISELDVDDIQLETDTPRSAIYRGVLCLSALKGARDFCTGEPMALNDCEDDHIFPKALYAKEHPVDGILNRAFIRKECNNHKRAKPPSLFFEHCLQGHGGDETLLLTTLWSQLISPDGYRALLKDDFDGFIEQRRTSVKEAIAQRISTG